MSLGSTVLATMYAYHTADIGQWSTSNGNTMGRSRLPGEALFDVPITLTNVVVGSSWRVEETDGTNIGSGTAISGTVTLNVPFYGANRQIIIKVRKGTTSPKYQPYQMPAVVTEYGSSVFVVQVPDPIA